MIRPLMARVRSLFNAAARNDAMNRDVHEEFEFHIEQRAQDLAGDGVALGEARRRARLEFGSASWYAEEARASRGIAWWDETRADARYAYRQLRASPLTYTAAAVVIAVPFALMISAYALVDGILLRPLPMPGAERVAGLWERREGSAPDVLTRVAPPVFTRWRADTVHFETVAGWTEESVVYSGGASAARLAVAAATPELFELFGARPMIGRFYSRNDDRVGAPGVVVLSHALWSLAFASDTGVVGRSMRLDGRPYTIAGVAPPVVQPPGGTVDVFMPLAPFLAGAEDVAGAKFLLVAGRLRPIANHDVVREQLERSSESVPGNDGWSAVMVPLQEQLTGPARSGLLLLLAGGVLVMLIACANVAALLLSRAPVRARELSMRSALGASRARLVRQLLTESLMLAVIACGAGVALSSITLDAVLALGPGDLPRRGAIAVDLRVLAFGMAGLAGVLLAIGTAPALLATRSAATTHWRAASDRLSTGPAGRRVTRSLTAAEVAITVVLLGTATLLLQTFRSVMAVDPGFQPDRVTTVDLSLAQHRYDAPEAWAAFVAELVSRVQTTTGTDLVAVSNNVPVSGRNMTSPIVVPGRPATSGASDPRAHVAAVTPEFFGTLGIRVMRGRSFTSTDRAGAPPVAMISESLANELFPGQNPLGRQLRSMFGAPVLREVVGVVDDVHQTALTDAPAAVYYTPFAQDPKPALTLLVRSDRDPGAVVSVVRGAVRSIDVEQPITRTATMDELLSDSVARLRFLLRLIGIIATVALLVALCGVYATMAATVEERRGEIGVRMALGARAITVVRMVLWDGGRYIVAGTVIGVPILLASHRFFEGFLFGVQPDDPRVLAVVCLAVLVAALAGMIQPVRTATRVDPAAVLRR